MTWGERGMQTKFFASAPPPHMQTLLCYYGRVELMYHADISRATQSLHSKRKLWRFVRTLCS